jgi:lipopolysaccharide/colanic/teichoic acid biosynthesis glycosyltransferase
MRQSPGRSDGGVAEIRVSDHSGLLLTLSNGMPLEPEQTAGRRAVLQLKRVIDLPLAVVALLALSPLLLGVALAIRITSPGPALFAQWRVGLNGRAFRMLKFRTLRADACDAAGLDQVVERDERVTPLGRMLRATSIDELPQLWNIVIGDMAIVGPRPMVGGAEGSGALYRSAVPYYDYRHKVRPGLSGWAQANGLRGPVGDLGAARQRIDHDCAYVQNLSLALDVRIIARTIAREFLTGSGV